MIKPIYKIGDKVIFNSQICIITDVGYSSGGKCYYFIKGYYKQNNIHKIITDKFLKPYKK